MAADTGRFLRATATYEDRHGTGKMASAVAYEVVTASLLTGLQVTTSDSTANPARALMPAFRAEVLHYAVGCAEAGDMMTVTPTAASGVRLAVDGVQVASGTSAMVAVRRGKRCAHRPHRCRRRDHDLYRALHDSPRVDN